MQKIPECRSMNFSIYEGMLNRYKDSEDIRKSYESRGLNGLEVIRAGEPDEGKILPDMVNGVHLYFHIFWMDWWKGNYERLDQEFDSREQWLEYFGGMSRESYLNSLRDDLAYAEQVGAKYVVFHVSGSDRCCNPLRLTSCCCCCRIFLCCCCRWHYRWNGNGTGIVCNSCLP